MIRQTNLGSKPLVHVATFGPVAHGKTTLLAAITRALSLRDTAARVSDNRLAGSSQEPAGAAASALQQVGYETEQRRYIHHDPHQTDCMKPIVSGAVETDGFILVVSASDEISHQLQEQLLLARSLRGPALVVLLNKVDLLEDSALLQRAELELRKQLAEAGFGDAESHIVRGSALAALECASQEPDAPEYRPIWELLEAMDAVLPAPQPIEQQPFLMHVEDSVHIEGHGTIMTGRVARGRVERWDVVASIGVYQEAHDVDVLKLGDTQQLVEQAGPGDRLAFLVRGIGQIDARHGHVLAARGSLTRSNRLTAVVSLLGQAAGDLHPPCGPSDRLLFQFGLGHSLGHMMPLNAVEELRPEACARVSVRLNTPLWLETGLRFTIQAEARVIGSGVVTAIEKEAGPHWSHVWPVPWHDISIETRCCAAPPRETDKPEEPETTVILNAVNAWVGDREEPLLSPLVVGQFYTLSFNVGRPLAQSIFRALRTQIPDNDIPPEGLPTTWQVMSRTVALEPCSDEVLVTTRREDQATIWLAAFELHVPKRGESNVVSLHVLPRCAGGARLDVIIRVRGELYRCFAVELAVAAGSGEAAQPPFGQAVALQNQVVFSLASQLGLRPPCAWLRPPGTLRLWISAPGRISVGGDVAQGQRSDHVVDDMVWQPRRESVVGQIGALRDAAEAFRAASENYLNAIDPHDLLDTLARFRPNQTWLPPASSAGQSHQQTWERVRRSGALQRLAGRGKRLYETLFPQGSPLRAWLDGLEPGHLIDLTWITADSIAGFPWGLLYIGDPEAPIDPWCFWGLRFRISYTAHSSTRLVSKHLGRPEKTFCGHWMYWGCQEGDPTLVEARWQRRVWADKPGALFAPDDPPGAHPGEQLRRLLKIKPGQMAVLYFFCQCAPDPRTNQPALRFGSTNSAEELLTTDNLPQSHMPDCALVFANACSTVASAPCIANDLEDFFFQKGCSAFLGTQTKVPIQFASRFAQIFFYFFYRQADPEHSPVAAGEAVAQARRFLWTHYCNIGGILYSYINQYELFMADQAEIAALRS